MIERKYSDEVQARIEQEQAAQADSVDNDRPEITSKFVMECLDANELGDGMLYAAIHLGRFIYVKDISQWYVWRNHYWQLDIHDEAVGAVESVALRYIEEIEILGSKLAASMATDSKEEGSNRQESTKRKISEIYKRVKKLRSDNGRLHCLRFAHTNPVNQLSISTDDFDLDPYLLACRNGVVDLKTGTLRPGKQEDYISKHSPVEWQGMDASVDEWTKVLKEIFEDNQDIIDFEQRLYGYGITGDVNEHVFSVHYGGGRNGKGLIFDMFMRCLGDYAGPIPSEMLLESNRIGTSPNQTSPELLALKGMRLAIASETDEGRKFSAAKVKWLTGGDTLTARGLYSKKPTWFVPTHLLCLLTNNKPSAPGTDSAFWGRCLLTHHRIKFVKGDPCLPNEHKADPQLYTSLKEELPGILAWLVKGCLMWQKHGLSPPEAITNATKEYQEDENYIGQFIEAAIELGEKFNSGAKELYQAFEIFYRENISKVERFIPSKTKFGQRLMATELFQKKRVAGMIKYYGLRLNPIWQSRVMTEGGDE